MSTSEQRPTGADTGQDSGANRKVSLWAIARSIAAAAFGVQSNRNQQRDFAHGNYRHFIVGGILFTILFVLAVVLVVRMVLQGAS